MALLLLNQVQLIPTGIQQACVIFWLPHLGTKANVIAYHAIRRRLAVADDEISCLGWTSKHVDLSAQMQY